MRTLIVCFLLLIVPACSAVGIGERRMCHLMGCTSSLGIDGASLETWATQDMEYIRVCVEDRCQTVTQADIDTAFASQGSNPLDGTFRIHDGDYRFEHIGWGITGDILDVTIEAATDAGVKQTSAEILFTEYAPNGPGCPPRCVHSDVAIKDDGSIETAAS